MSLRYHILSIKFTIPDERGPTIEVHGARPVFVDLLDDAVQVLLRQLVVQLLQDLPQDGSGDVAVACDRSGVRRYGQQGVTDL